VKAAVTIIRNHSQDTGFLPLFSAITLWSSH
jgi:hypothetical protein